MYKKLCVIALVSALILSAASITALAGKYDVTEATEEMQIEGYVQKKYENFADFKKEVANGELVKKLETGDFLVTLTNKVYTLQKNKVVSKLKIDYLDNETGSLKKEVIELDRIFCGPDSVAFSYDKDVYFRYYPDYKSDSVNNKVYIYNQAKENAFKSKVINKHRVYVTYNTFNKRTASKYAYTWVEDGCLFQITAPKEKGINYGFTLYKLKKANTFK